MKEEIKQPRRYNEKELSLIKNTFKDKEEILISVRKLIYQLELNDQDNDNIELLKKTDEVVKVIRKSILPEFEGDAPLFQITDRWLLLKGLTEMTPEGAQSLIRSREKTINYIRQQLDLLEGKEQGKLTFSGLLPNSEKNLEEEQTDLMARDSIVNLVEFQLNELKILSLEEEETKEEAEARLQANSNK